MSEEKPYQQFINKILGDKAMFSMENRAFNFVGLLTMGFLAYSLVFDFMVHQWVMCSIIGVLLVVQIVLYYYSRTRKRYENGILIYAVFCYLAMIVNYFNNDGIKGPTLFLFYITFLLLIATSARKYYRLWLILHISIAGSLLGWEYYQQEILHTPIKTNYLSETAHFLDIFSGYAGVIIFSLFIVNYLRKHYYIEKHLAEKHAHDLEIQSQQIVEQNKKLAEVNEEKNKLFSIVSHDLRAPIDSIRGFLEILSEGLLTEEEKVEIQDELLMQTKYTADMLSNLLYWSKSQMNGVKVKLVPLKLIDAVDASRNYKMATAAKKGIKLTYIINKELEVIADKDMLQIVLRNLLNNAIKFTPENGEIIISATRVQNNAQISIKDTGIGIPLEKQSEIFSVRSGTRYGTNNEKGIGLGLMLVKELMDYQGGKIWFESEAGKGSIFHLSFPLARM